MADINAAVAAPESIRLSWNQLSGGLPLALGRLPLLLYLRLNDNKLAESIPDGISLLLSAVPE